MQPKNNSLPRNIFARGSLLYFRYSIPKDLIPIVGKAELRYSLRTGYLHLAKNRSQKLIASLNLFNNLLRNSFQMQELTDQQIQKLLKNRLKEALEGAEQNRVEAPKRPSFEQLDHLSQDYSMFESNYRDFLSTNDYREVHDSADELLKENGFEVNRESISYKKLCRELMKIGIRFFQAEQKRIYADYSDEFELIASGNNTPSPDGPKFSKLFLIFIDEYMGSNRWTEKTKAENEAIFKLFIDIVGDIPVTDLDYETAQKFKSTLQKLPANKNKVKEYRDKSISQILSMPDVKPMAVNSINKNLTRMSQFLKWVQKNGYVDKNVLEGMVLPEDKRKDQQRKAFSKADIHQIFSNKLFTEKKYLHSYMFWLPLLGLYTGARLEELSSLYLEDFQVIEGIPAISINSTRPDKKLKTKSAERFIPIHPDLIKLGLMKYVEKLKRNNVERLFPELKRSRDGYGKNASRWFGRFKEKCGFYTEDKVFHSFRHSFADHLKKLGVSQIRAAELLGHDRSDNITYGRYGKPDEVKSLLEDVAKMNFELDLKMLNAK